MTEMGEKIKMCLISLKLCIKTWQVSFRNSKKNFLNYENEYILHLAEVEKLAKKVRERQ